MALYQTVSYSDTGTKASLNMDPSIAPFNASVAVTLATTGTYKIQFSLDPMTIADAAALWFDSANFPASSATSILSNINFPVSRLRIVIAANGSGIVLQVSQGFTDN